MFEKTNCLCITISQLQGSGNANILSCYYRNKKIFRQIDKKLFSCNAYIFLL